MNGSTGYLVTSILFLFAGIISLLTVDLDTLGWYAVVPSVFLLIVAGVYFYNYLKYKNRDEKS